MVSNNAKHTKHRPTKEEFYAATFGSEMHASSKGYHAGPLIDADAENGYCTAYIPKDFDEIEEIVIAVIPQVTLATMWVQVVTAYGFDGQPEDTHTDVVNQLSFTAINNDRIEVNIKAAVNVALLEPGDYLAVRLTRLAGQNTNLIFLGVRIKYKYK